MKRAHLRLLLPALVCFLSYVGALQARGDEVRGKTRRDITPILHQKKDSTESVSTTKLRGILVEGNRTEYDPDNPAIALVQATALAQKEEMNSLDSADYTFYKSDRLTLSLSNFKLESSFLNSLFPFFHEYVLPSKLDGSWTLPLSRRYEFGEVGHSGSLHKTSEIVRYREHVGLDENIDDGTMTSSLDELFPRIDLFREDIRMLQNRFVSPLSLERGKNFYKYYLTDTVIMGGKVAYTVDFFPLDANSPSLRGTLYISAGDPPRLLRAVYTIPDDRHLNFLDRISIRQDYAASDSCGHWQLKGETLAASFKLYQRLLSLYVEQNRHYTDHNHHPSDTLLALRETTPTILDLSGEPIARRYGDLLQKDVLLVEDSGLRRFLEQIKSFPLYKTLIDASDMIARGYIRTMWRHDKVYGGSQFDIGPIGTFWSRNSTEGIRLRLGGNTTGYLNNRMFLEGYVAYGTNDKRWKYYAALTYSFNKKRYFRREYPQHEITIGYRDDIFLPGQNFENNEKDNILYNLGTAFLTNRSYRKEATLEYTHDLKAGLRFSLLAKRFEDTPVDGSGYVRVRRVNQDTTIIRVPNLTDLSLRGEIRWAPGERIYNGSMQRESPLFRRLQKEVPVFLLRHEVGLPIWGGEIKRQRTEVSVEHRLWMRQAGRLDYKVEIGKIWNPVPYPLLYTPPVNRAFWLNERSFQAMRPYELVGDEWATAFLEWHLRGLVLGRVKFLKSIGPPFFVLSANYLFGNTSKKNSNETRAELFVLPTVSTEMHLTHYGEIGLGLENIFRFFRVDVYRRLTPVLSSISPSPWAVRARLGVTF